MSNKLGIFLKTLIINKGYTQKVFSQKIELSVTNLSLIINGKIRPRQSTISKIMRVLSLSKEDEQKLLKLYDNNISIPEDKSSSPEPIKIYQENKERVYRYLEMKARSVAFVSEIENMLKNNNIEFRKNHISKGIICDFFLENKNIALECKFNAMRDVERTLTSAKIILENLKLANVLIVVPLKYEIDKKLFKDAQNIGCEIVSISELITNISKLD